MRYLITGGSGYIGSRLVERLARREGVERILICDIRPPRAFRPKVEFEQLDVTDKSRVRELIEREKPDVLIHLAFVLNPIHDEFRMYHIDVGGTQNVLEAAEAAGVQQLLVTSSATAYGAFPDNPVPISEEQTVRGVPDFEYARDKAECDRLCQLWALRNADRVMTQLANDTDLKYAEIDLCLFHVNSGILLRLWKGVIQSYATDGTAIFPVTCSDGFFQIMNQYPELAVLNGGCHRMR